MTALPGTPVVVWLRLATGGVTWTVGHADPDDGDVVRFAVHTPVEVCAVRVQGREWLEVDVG